MANSISNKIQFTVETPNEDGFLAFLDFEIKMVNNKFETRLYSKDIHSGTIYPWKSNGPISMKKAIMKGEINRAIRRSTNETNQHHSINKVLQRFKNNGYPNKIIQATMKDVIKKSQNPADNRTSKTETSPGQKIFIQCPYVGERERRHFTAIVRRLKLQDKVKLWFNSGKSLKKIFHPPKEKKRCPMNCLSCKSAKYENTCNIKFVIYEISCEICHAIYIGETKRPIGQRILEHINTTTSAVRNHFDKEHTGRQTENSITWRILHRNLTSTQKRLLTETMYINKFRDNHNLLNTQNI